MQWLTLLVNLNDRKQNNFCFSEFLVGHLPELGKAVMCPTRHLFILQTSKKKQRKTLKSSFKQMSLEAKDAGLPVHAVWEVSQTSKVRSGVSHLLTVVQKKKNVLN